MKAKSVLLTVPLAIRIDVPDASGQRRVLVVEAMRRLSGVRLRSADGIPGRAPTVAGRRQCASGLDRRSGRSARGDGGTGSGRGAGTTEAAQEARGNGDRGA